MGKLIDTVEVTLFDTETTGLSALGGDRVIEVAAIRFKADTVLATMDSLIYSDVPVSAGAFAVNKISAQMLMNAPTAYEVIGQFMRLSNESLLCSYNAVFDLEFMNQELRLLNQPEIAAGITIDILKMARWLLPGLPRYSLAHVAGSLGIQTPQQHRALSDVMLEFEVFKILKNKAANAGVSVLEEFIQLFGVDKELLNEAILEKAAFVEKAIAQGMKLRLVYFARSDSRVSERIVIPHEIRKENSGVYLTGYCCLRNQERIFNLECILRMDVA